MKKRLFGGSWGDVNIYIYGIIEGSIIGVTKGETMAHVKLGPLIWVSRPNKPTVFEAKEFCPKPSTLNSEPYTPNPKP